MGNSTLKNRKNILFSENEKKVGFSLKLNLVISPYFKMLFRAIIILL